MGYFEDKYDATKNKVDASLHKAKTTLKDTNNPLKVKSVDRSKFKGPTAADETKFAGPAQINVADKTSAFADQRRQNIPTANAAKIATGDQDQIRSNQQGLISALQARASGEAPSAGQIALQRQTESGLKNLLAAAASRRGGSAAAGDRALAQGVSQLGQDAAGKAGEIAAAEQAAAEQNLGSVLQGVRGQDIGLATSQAGLQQQTNLANLQSQQQAQQAIDDMTKYYEDQGFGREMAQQQAGMEFQRLEQKRKAQDLAAQQAYEQLELQRRQGTVKAGTSLVGSIGQAATAFAVPGSPSDKNAKKNIKKENPRKFLDALKSFEYEYKDPKHGKGTFISVMAQDLEKAGPIGKSMVSKDEEGVKRVDYGKGFATMLASQVDNNERIKRLEMILKARKEKK